MKSRRNFLTDLGYQFLHSLSYIKIYRRQADEKGQDLVVLKHALFNTLPKLASRFLGFFMPQNARASSENSY